MNKRTLHILEQSRSRGWVLEPEAREIMKLNGLDSGRFRWIKGVDDIASLQKGFKFPAIVKVVSPEIMHKTDKGGVVKNLQSIEEVAEAFRNLTTLQGFEGILVDEMITGTEVIMGSKHDPQFGMVVLIGIGGTSVEIYRDTAIRLAPLSTDEALRAIESLRGIKLLRGFRGVAPVNLVRLAGVFSRFSKIVCALGDRIESIDLNPVICSEDRITAVDARILLRQP